MIDTDKRKKAFIKLSSLANFRQTQACDRCRLKKIKCDGARPTCSNCAKINFVCKVSDKLVRRGFPRGYTEALEKEVVRLQNLLNNATKVLDSIPHPSDPTSQQLQPQSQHVQRTQPLTSQGGTTSNFQNVSLKFSFINDNFYRFNNYLFRSHDNTRQIFLGHRTWNSAASQQINADATRTLDHCPAERDPLLREVQFNLLIGSLKLDPQFLYPQFLNSLYGNNYNLIKNLIKAAIANFFKYQNSLIPLLYPQEMWESKLIDLVDSGFLTERDPVNLLTLLYIIQISWCGIDDARLFELTKLVLTEANTTTLQVANLASYYFMGNCLELGNSANSDDNRRQNGRNNCEYTHTSDDTDQLRENEAAILWSSELLNIAYSKVLTMGLYVNSNNLVVVTGGSASGESSDASSREKSSIVETVTLWCSQFLYTWWSFIQGLPKINFLIDEFQPRSIDSLNIPTLKPFHMLLAFVITSLDGCNLTKTLSDPENSKLIYIIENFGHVLRSNRLFYPIHSHCGVLTGETQDSDIYASPSVDAVQLQGMDIAEIQLTLFYLVLSLLSVSKVDQQRPQTQGLGPYPNLAHSVEEISHEILTLYYLLMISDGKTGPYEPLKSKNAGTQCLRVPRLFRILHILPIQSSVVIRSCLHNLVTWGALNAKQITNDRRGVFWQYTKYRNFLTQWIKITSFDHPHSDQPGKNGSNAFDMCGVNSLMDEICRIFSIDINRLHPTGLSKIYHQDPVTYMKQLATFSTNPTRTPGITRPGSRVTMDQFSTFAPSNTDLFSQFKNLVSPKISDVNRGVFSPSEEARREPHSLTRRGSNNDYNHNNTDFPLGQTFPQFPSQTPAPITTQTNHLLGINAGESKSGGLSHMSLSTLFLLSPLLDKKQEDIDDGYVEEDDDDDDNLEPLAFHFNHLKKGLHSGHISAKEKALNQPIPPRQGQRELKQLQQHDLARHISAPVHPQGAPTHILQKFSESERKRPTLENIVLNEEDPTSAKRSKPVQNSTTNKISQILSG